MLTHSDKPLVGSARTAANARASIDMASLAVGDETPSKPVVLGRVHPRSPRRWNEPIVDGLREFAADGQPLIVSSGAIAGASAPVSLSETVVLANAETLFGLVLAQVTNAGTPVLFGYASTHYDPDAGAVAYGGPTSSLLSSIGVRMGQYYDLPARTEGGVTDAKTLGDQSGSESMRKLAGAFDSGADLVFNAAGLLDTYETISPAKFVLDCERIRDLQWSAGTHDTLVDSLASDVSLDRIRDAAPGDAFTDERDPSSVADAPSVQSETARRGRYTAWEDAGAETAVDRAAARVDDLLEVYERPPVDESVRHTLRDYVDAHADS
ncbi:trimethylamine methyltransferase family protein [Haloarculaceae archaeon H-GB2-1]|nr:trimethylamine methyltransferase family protein [Haloarculaceae archaeon H-GB11]MEA5408342.1 trimethylamine methyltransferase family protein [Haloarculaceae archaeon H-GB2-1]